MNENLRLDQQQRQQQRLNPRQVVFGRYLEMTAPEIEDEVRRAVDENPALEVIDDSTLHNDSEHSESFAESAEQLQLADYAEEDDIPSDMSRDNFITGYGKSYDMFDTTDESSVMDIMEAQLADIDLTSKEQIIARYIIGNLDDNGYITRSMADIADDITIAEGIDVSTGEAKSVFAKVRKLDPAGIGAVDLRDCLLLQIERHETTLTTKIAKEIIADWFDLFSKKHFDQLRSHLGVDAGEMQSALEYIRSLNPKPGALLEKSGASDRLRHIIPDFAVDVDHNGHATVSLLNNIPELAIEQSFSLDNINPASTAKRDADAMAFIRRRHDDATMFIDMLRMRADTLLAVMRSIVKIQHRFFETNDRSTIRPMIIRDIAAMTGLDISVISRAAAGKYVLTSQGVYPLKMFFNERPKEDTDTSSHEILDALSKLIESEDKQHPLSDEALSTSLEKLGYNIARRTVTKYRERLGLPVARLRKQY